MKCDDVDDGGRGWGEGDGGVVCLSRFSIGVVALSRNGYVDSFQSSVKIQSINITRIELPLFSMIHSANNNRQFDN